MSLRTEQSRLLRDGISCYKEILSKSRTQLNLIGPREDLDEHIDDCIVAVDHFLRVSRQLLKERDTQKSIDIDGIESRLMCVDLGTGAGLPGIPLLLCLLAEKVPAFWFLLEKSGKKSAFLTKMVQELNTALSLQLPLRIVHENLYAWQLEKRLQSLPCLVTARAFRPLTSQLLASINLAAPSSTLLLYKGRHTRLTQELDGLDDRLIVENVFPLHCTHKKERHLLIARIKD